jgi:hypothetical protein
MKPPVTGLPRPERRLKPTPHKNVGSFRVDRSVNMPKDTNTSSRHMDGTATKSLARRTRAIARVASSRRQSLPTDQRRKCVIGSDILPKVISYVRIARLIALPLRASYSIRPR